MAWDTIKDRQRRKLIDQQQELRRKMMYTANLTEEEKASIQMQIGSLQRRIDASTGNEDIFSPKYANVKSNGADIFAPESNEISEADKAWLFSGQDFNVPKPTKEYPHLTYYCQFQNGKKR